MENIEQLQRLYHTITNGLLPDDPDSIQQRINIIRLFEGLTRDKFKNTKDFRAKTSHFIMKNEVKLIQ